MPSSAPLSLPARSRHPRRVLRTTAVLAAALVALSSCSSATSADDESAGSGETRTVTDSVGEVKVPTDPRRVVATDFYSASVLVDVGIVPVGVMEGADVPDSRPERYVDALRDVAEISTYAEINVEKVLDLEPDLIIVDAEFPEPETLDRLAEIAPLFRVDVSGAWSERALSIADAVGKLEEAQAQQKEYEARAAEISTTYRDLLDDTPLAVVSLNTNEATWASYPPDGWPMPVWVDVDAVFREPTTGETTSMADWAWVSDEQLEKLDNAGMIVVLEPEQLKRYEDNRVWNSLPAVTSGHVYSGFVAPATSSFLWGIDSLDWVEETLQKVGEE